MQFTNRYLSENLNVNFQKWKRWSREFLPREQVAGLAKGYQREYTYGEAFRVFIGGHLVSGMGYTIPAAKQILDDLNDWLTEQGYFSEALRHIPSEVKSWEIRIEPIKKFGFAYTYKGLLDGPKMTSFKGIKNAQTETYIENRIVIKGFKGETVLQGMGKKLCLSNLRGIFTHFLGI